MGDRQHRVGSGGEDKCQGMQAQQEREGIKEQRYGDGRQESNPSGRGKGEGGGQATGRQVVEGRQQGI